MRGVILAVLATTGCDVVFGLEGREPPVPDGPPIAPGCAGELFMGPVILPGLEGTRRFQPQLRHDQLEIWFQEMELRVARRTSTTGAFGAAVEAFPATGSESEACLSGDGLRLVFMSDRTGTDSIWEATRASLGDSFGAASIVVGQDDYNRSIDLSYDSLTLYYETYDDPGELWARTRPALGMPFTNPTMLAANVWYFSVSPDGLELFYNPENGTNLYRRVRASTNVPFEPIEQLLLDDGEDPDLAPDGETLIAGTGGGLGVLTRDCP